MSIGDDEYNEIDKKIKILEEKIEKIHGELKSKAHSVAEIPVAKVDIKKEENIIESNANKYNWDILDITPKNIFMLTANGKFNMAILVYYVIYILVRLYQ